MPMPFQERELTFTNPDGTEFQVRGSGDQFHAVFETLDGYTVTKDPATGFYQYARLSDSGDELLPTGVNVNGPGRARDRLGPRDVKRVALAPREQRVRIRAASRDAATTRIPPGDAEDVGRDLLDVGDPVGPAVGYPWHLPNDPRLSIMWRATGVLNCVPPPMLPKAGAPLSASSSNGFTTSRPAAGSAISPAAVAILDGDHASA